MAVEAKRIKERLKALFPGVNLSAKRIDELSARLAQKPADDADDTAIDQVINDANDFMPFKDIAREDDRVRTLEANQKSQDPPSPPNPPQDPPADPPKTEDVPAWAKAMLESNEILKKELQEIKTGKIIESKRESARKLFENNETLRGLKETVKEKWFNRIDVNSETPVEDQIAELESEYSDLVQVSADHRRSAGAPPNGGPNSKPTDAELDAVVAGI